MNNISLKKIGLLLFLTVSNAVMANPQILIVYYSQTGHTATLAEAIYRGAKSVQNIDVKIASVQQTTIEDVKKADGIIIGSPVYNANIAPQVQQFINSWPLHDPSYKYKVASAFVTAGGISAGEEGAQFSLIRSLMIFNFIIVGGNNWHAPFGATAISNNPLIKNETPQDPIHPDFLKNGEALGKRVANLVFDLHQLKQNKTPQT